MSRDEGMIQYHDMMISGEEENILKLTKERSLD